MKGEIEPIALIPLLIFSLILVVASISFQNSAAIDGIDYSSTSFGNSLKAQSYALHLFNPENELETAIYEKSEFQQITGNCRISEESEQRENLMDFGGSTAEVLIETVANNCENEEIIQNPAILGVPTKEGGESEIGKVIIR